MGYIFALLNQLLFILVLLQCSQARMKHSDQGYIGNSYVDQSNSIDAENKELSVSPKDEANKMDNGDLRTDYVKMAENNEEEALARHSKSEKRRRNIHRQKANGEKRKSKQETVHSKGGHRLKAYNRDDIESSFEGGPTDNEHETGNFYLTRPSDIANTSAMLGPGPIAIKLTDQIAQTLPPSLTDIQKNGTKIGLDDLRNVANISSENDGFVSFVGEHKRGNKNKLKLRQNFRQPSDEFMNWDNIFFPIRQSKTKSRLFHKYNPAIQQNEPDNNLNVRRKKMKFKGVKNDSPDKRLGKENYNNANEQYANLSDINKSLKSAASKRFDLKNGYFNSLDGETSVDKERSKILVDKLSDEDAKKICLLNAERELSEEQHTPLRDATAEVENKNENAEPRRVSNNGIRSKIEHGDWFDHITLLPIPDYSIRKNIGHKKHEGFFGSKIEYPEVASVTEENDQRINRKHRKKTSVSSMDKNYAPFIEEPEGKLNEQEGQFSSKNVFDHGSDMKNKRDERDLKSRLLRHDSKTPNERSIFNRHTDTSGVMEDEMNHADTKHNINNYFIPKKNQGNTYISGTDSEKAEDYYEYDSNLSENSATELCVANKTYPTTQSTFASTIGISPTTQPTRKPYIHQNSPQTNSVSENGGIVNNTNDVQKNNTVDSYENFLNGQLADSFVDAVLKKLKLSRKISRELGYGNETEETCDRCIELKQTNVPNLAVMRNSLGKCSRNYTSADHCCAVPKPMLKYLDVLVYSEKENENNFYNKIQDDSSFIFTGDYSDSLKKGESNKRVDDNYMEGSSFNKDSTDKQHLKEDENDEKTDKIEITGPLMDVKERNIKEDNPTKGQGIEDKGGQGNKNKDKGHMRRFSKNKIDNKQDDTFFDFDKHARPSDLLAGLNDWELDPLAKEDTANEESERNNYHPRQELGKSWSDVGEAHVGTHQDAPGKPQRNPVRNFDRYYGQSNLDYFKQNPNRISHNRPRYGYRPHNPAGGSFKEERQSQNSFYSMPVGNDNKYNDESQIKINNQKTYGNQAISNGIYKGYQSKYDLLYNDNGEYSLYTNLDGTSEEDSDKMSGKYKVKRDAENPSEYDEEPSMLFEVPVVEYDLY